MKSVMLFFAVMAMVFASCSKSELESVPANGVKEIVLNIGNVGNPCADETKAFIKTGWARDDRIKIWFNGNNGKDPDLVIQFDGEKWNQVGIPAFLPAASGYLKAVHKSVVIVASKDNYQVKDNILTIDISNWIFLSEIQVVVAGIPNRYDSYNLKCNKFYPLQGEGYIVGTEEITADKKDRGKPARNESNQDGVAFVFATADYSTSSSDAEDFTFTLRNNSEDEEFYYKKNVAITAIEGKKQIKALKIKYASFGSREQ